MTPPVSACRDDNVASSRVNESKLSRPSWGSPGRLLTSVRTKRYWKYWPSNRRSRLSGPEIENRGSNLLTNANPLPNPGIRLFGLKTHSSVPRLVRTCVTLVENRPYSAAKGSTAPRPIPPRRSAARDRNPGRRVVEARAAHLQRAGRGGAALDAQPAVWTADDAGEHGEERLKIVAREWLDIHLRARQQSLTATGCRLSVGELAGTTTSTLSRTNVNRISTSTCCVSPPCTMNGADSLLANPSRTAFTR